MIDIRKDMAEAAIRKKLEKGHKLGGISGVEKILQEFVEVSRLPEAFFKVLKGRDLCDLLAKATDSVVPGPTSDVMTPANSEDYVEELSEVRREGEQGIEGTQDEAKEGVKSPTYEDPVSDTDISSSGSANVSSQTIGKVVPCDDPHSQHKPL